MAVQPYAVTSRWIVFWNRHWVNTRIVVSSPTSWSLQDLKQDLLVDFFKYRLDSVRYPTNWLYQILSRFTTKWPFKLWSANSTLPHLCNQLNQDCKSIAHNNNVISIICQSLSSLLFLSPLVSLVPIGPIGLVIPRGFFAGRTLHEGCDGISKFYINFICSQQSPFDDANRQRHTCRYDAFESTA